MCKWKTIHSFNELKFVDIQLIHLKYDFKEPHFHNVLQMFYYFFMYIIKFE